MRTNHQQSMVMARKLMISLMWRMSGRCNVLALQSEANDEFYNVGTGIQTSIRELCNTILDLKQSKLEVTYNPYSADDARRMVQNRIGCPKKAQQDFGFTYQYDLQTGLQRLIDWRNQHGAE